MTTIPDLELRIARITAEIGQLKSDTRSLFSRVDNKNIKGDSLHIRAGIIDTIKTDGAIVSIANYLTRSGEVDNFISLGPSEQTFVVGDVDMVTLTNATQDIIRIGDGSDIDINSNDGQTFLEGSSGFFGIGTILPESLAHLKSTGDARLIIEADSDDSGENDNPRLELRQDGGNIIGGLGFVGTDGQIFTNSLTNAIYLVGDDSAPLQLGTLGVARVTIKSGGDVGIGTTDPDSKLVVNGDMFIGPPAASGDTADSDLTIGLSINQEGNDDDAFNIKSSDVNHGMTSIRETDTYCTFRKIASDGGANTNGFSSSNRGYTIGGNVATGITSKSTSSLGAVELRGALKSGTSTGDMGDFDNVVIMRNNDTTIWMVNGQGDVYRGGADDGVISDSYDDSQLLVGFRALMSPTDSPAHRRFTGFLRETEEILIQQGVLTEAIADGGLISETALDGLMIDAIYQLSTKDCLMMDTICQLSAKVGRLEERLNGIN